MTKQPKGNTPSKQGDEDRTAELPAELATVLVLDTARLDVMKDMSTRLEK